MSKNTKMDEQDILDFSKCGLTLQETADVLGLDKATVKEVLIRNGIIPDPSYDLTRLLSCAHYQFCDWNSFDV